MKAKTDFDVAVIGGGPSGATAANDLARAGVRVLLIDRQGRIKPCGGAVPPRLIRDFAIPDAQIVARVNAARIIAPSEHYVDMHIGGGYVGMVDREHFDEFLRDRAEHSGATRISAKFDHIEFDTDQTPIVHAVGTGADAAVGAVKFRVGTVIGADGAKSKVARQCVPGADEVPYVSAYHEIIEAPKESHPTYLNTRCDVIYDGALSPDFYSWVFPHGESASIGVGTAHRGVSMRSAIAKLRAHNGLINNRTIRTEGAPIPMRPMKRWDNGKNVLLAGDAAGVVAPASGEGIYYAMLGGRLAGEAMLEMLENDEPAKLKLARKRFMKDHGQVFFALGMMQKFWYANDNRRERFVRICHDRDVQRLTWDSYMNKELVRANPLVNARIFMKNIAHLSGLAAVS
ncbi:MAG: geranylgeranyl diphosphate reductase [Burkholderiaceae bacterium]